MNGLPEGGSVGPATYTQLPNSLTERLLENGFGVGQNIEMPMEWAGHVWHGTGSPVKHLVNSFCEAIRAGRALPNKELLKRSPAMEASAARALDLCAESRIVTVLHADDPVFVSSSLGALSEAMVEVLSWCLEHGAMFHVTSGKSLVMPFIRSDAVIAEMPTLLELPGEIECQLRIVSRLKWLGLWWPSDCDHSASREKAINAATRAFGNLCGLVSSGAVPLPIALRMFHSKVDSILDFGRWLFVFSPGAKERLDNLQFSWARQLLGAECWRNGAVCSAELGWKHTDFAKALRSVALRRARIWLLPDDDLYRRFFIACVSTGCGWAKASILLMQEAGIPDWSTVRQDCSDYDQYREHIDHVLQNFSWEGLSKTVDRHSAAVPYYNFQKGISHALERLVVEQNWELLRMSRNWCRMRIGDVVLSGVNGKRSCARYQICIFCGDGVRNATVHALARCRCWEDFRRQYRTVASLPEDISADSLCLKVIGCTPTSSGFAEAVVMMDRIASASLAHWSNKKIKHDVSGGRGGIWEEEAGAHLSSSLRQSLWYESLRLFRSDRVREKWGVFSFSTLLDWGLFGVRALCPFPCLFPVALSSLSLSFTPWLAWV